MPIAAGGEGAAGPDLGTVRHGRPLKLLGFEEAREEDLERSGSGLACAREAPDCDELRTSPRDASACSWAARSPETRARTPALSPRNRGSALKPLRSRSRLD